MKPLTFMIIAGEPSGDLLAAELVRSLRAECLRRSPLETPHVQPLRTALAPRFFGAGGPKMAEAGVDLVFDLTQHSIIGLWEVVKRYGTFRRLFKQLVAEAARCQPDAIICVDFSGFNHRFARAIRNRVADRRGPFINWNPRLVQFVSPQVWASRPGRARRMVNVFDLLLSTLPFEKDWYAQHAPLLPVAYVGNPLIDRHPDCLNGWRERVRDKPRIVVLPGSRTGELKKHLPVLAGVIAIIRRELPSAQFSMVIPDESLKAVIDSHLDSSIRNQVDIRVGDISGALREADLAVTKSGTITLECALYGVPAVVFYRTSALTYAIGRRLVTVGYLSMPNLLLNEPVFPEFVQVEATPERIATASLKLLRDPELRASVQSKLREAVALLGGPGACDRAASRIANLVL